MCILLKRVNHKELLTSTNNGIKTVEIVVTVSKQETRCCINILYYRYHGIRNIYQKIYIFRKGCRSARRKYNIYIYIYGMRGAYGLSLNCQHMGICIVCIVMTDCQ